MKAVFHDRYGPPDVLRVEDVPVPTPAAGQVRVRVAATSVNLSDWEGLVGSPAYARLGGLRTPAHPTLGSDIAGVVDAVGDGVTRFRLGDEVYGDNLALMGGFAELAIAPESALARKPPELSFVQASTIPQAGAIALQGTRYAATGGRVLVNGAGGGSGSFAIQLAQRLGAHVTGVDNATKQDFMRSMGADEVIDYRRVDFTRPTEPYDLVLDLVAHRSVFAYRRALARGGTLPVRRRHGALTAPRAHAGPVVGAVTGRSLGVLVVKQGPAHFEPLAELCVAGGGADRGRPGVLARPGGRRPRPRRRGACAGEGRRHARATLTSDRWPRRTHVCVFRSRGDTRTLEPVGRSGGIHMSVRHLDLNRLVGALSASVLTVTVLAAPAEAVPPPNDSASSATVIPSVPAVHVGRHSRSHP